MTDKPSTSGPSPFGDRAHSHRQLKTAHQAAQGLAEENRALKVQAMELTRRLLKADQEIYRLHAELAALKGEK